MRYPRLLMGQKNTFERIKGQYILPPFIVGVFLLSIGIFCLKFSKDHQNIIFGFIAAVIILFGTILVCIAMVYACILLYRIWSILQDGKVRTTPEKAIGFLFIPFFNFYWIFVVYYGLAVDFNRYVLERKLDIALLSIPLFLATCILPIVSLFPYIMYVAYPVNIVVDIIVLYQMLGRYNALVDKKIKIN
jgi:hypothetical protein